MPNVTFRTKVRTVYNHDDTVAYRYVQKPKLTRSHVNMHEWRTHPRFGAYANSDLFPGILKRQTEHVPDLIRLDRIPNGVTIDESGFLAEVTITID